MTVKQLRTEEEQLSRLIELKKNELEKLSFSERDAQEKVRVQNELLDCKKSEVSVYARKLEKMKKELNTVSTDRERTIEDTEKLKKDAKNIMDHAKKVAEDVENKSKIIDAEMQKLHAERKEIEGKKEKIRNFIKTF